MSSMLEKLNQMKEEVAEKEISQESKSSESQQVPQMSIGEQLNVLQEVKRIDYQNSLVMTSLQKYNKKYEELKTEQTKLLENIKSQTQTLQESNNLLSQNMKKTLEGFTEGQKKEISVLVDNAKKVLLATEMSLNQKAEQVRQETEKFINNCEENKKKVEMRYESFFGRWKIFDYLIIADLLIMPIIIGFIAYKVFIVWG